MISIPDVTPEIDSRDIVIFILSVLLITTWCTWCIQKLGTNMDLESINTEIELPTTESQCMERKSYI